MARYCWVCGARIRPGDTCYRVDATRGTAFRNPLRVTVCGAACADEAERGARPPSDWSNDWLPNLTLIGILLLFLFAWLRHTFGG